MLPCSKRFVHDWTECPFAHPQEKARRRDPRVQNYTGIACPSMKKASREGACLPVGWLGLLVAALQGSQGGVAGAWGTAGGVAGPSRLPPRAAPVCVPARRPTQPPPTLCPFPPQEGCCAFGDHCPYAHNVFEYWLHPTRYRTQLCNDGSNCKRKICFFAHRWVGAAAGRHLKDTTCSPGYRWL